MSTMAVPPIKYARGFLAVGMKTLDVVQPDGDTITFDLAKFVKAWDEGEIETVTEEEEAR